MTGTGRKVFGALVIAMGMLLSTTPALATKIQIGSFTWGPVETDFCQTGGEVPDTCYGYVVENGLSGLLSDPSNPLEELNLNGDEPFTAVSIVELGAAGDLGDIFTTGTAYSQIALSTATVVLTPPAAMVGTLLPAVFDLTDMLYDPGIYVETLTSVPEPGTLGFLAFGAGALCAGRRRWQAT